MDSLQRIEIKGGSRLAEQPETGHNRWHEDVPPILEVEDGETVVLDTRDGFDGQVSRDLAPESYDSVSVFPTHAMTGPVLIREAKPGDVLEVHIEDIEPDPFDAYGFTMIFPGFGGILAEQFDGGFVAHWELRGRDYAESPQIPGVRIPFQPFCGLVGVAPDTQFRRLVTEREARLAMTGAMVLQPDPLEAIPSGGAIAVEGLRTIPPRENGGNLDVKQLGAGTSVFLRVLTAGALFSLGDAHYAQGDGESCGSAIEMRARVRVRLQLHKGVSTANVVKGPLFTTTSVAPTPPGHHLGAVGFCVQDGENHSRDLTVAARQAVERLVGQLVEAGYSKEQAYVIVSVAADLRVSQAVNIPNVSVTALLPLSIFTDEGSSVIESVARRGF